ncbi:hypothetical protein HMI54_013844, partial [Coelomomyces lativittatus]
IIYTLLAVIVFTSVTMKVQAQLPPLPQTLPRLFDSLALVRFYNAAGGDDWINNDNWKSSEPISTWFGTVSAATALWNSLRVFNVSGNSLSGTTNLTAFLAGKLQLERLDISNNNFSGAAPFTLANLPNLISVNLSNNSFTGALPELTASNEVEEIYLTDNDFTESIPASYGIYETLVNLYLDSNRLSS